MIIEYLYNDRCVKHTYRNVAFLRHGTGDTVHLYGMDTALNQFYQEYFIACIHLDKGEMLERVDV